MPSAHETRLDAMLDAHFAEYGENATYTPQAGMAVELEVVWRDGDSRLSRRDDGQRQIQQDEVIIRQSALPRPERGAALLRQATSETWTIFDFEPRGASAWLVQVSRAQTTERLAGRYRAGG
ncbi:MAG TPA: hypothetical protein P5137_00950 [Candidatus Brocadiia bacterium]|nr:hypothetical protein [Candidatus Brocadiia bacterium]